MTPKCEGCAKPCNSPYNEDGECWGRMTPEEQEALNNFLVKKFEKPSSSILETVKKPVEKTKIEQGFTWD